MNNQYLANRDLYFSTFAGLFIGLLLLPVLNTAKPEFFNFKIALSIVIFFMIATPLGVLVASIIGKKIPIIWQVAKFGVTGVMNFLVDLGVLSLLLAIFQDVFHIESKKTIFSLGILLITYYSLYKATSFIVANVNSYFWNKFWTFEDKSTEKKATEFTQFFIVSLVGFFINVFVASYVFKAISMPGFTSSQWGLIGAAVGSVAGLIWNFLGYKFIVFKK